MKSLTKIAGAILLCSASCASHASFVTSGAIQSVYDRSSQIGSTIDKISFTVESNSNVIFDVLSWEADDEGRATDDGFPEGVDLNKDGAFNFIDSMIYLFADDGLLTADDLIDSNDDSTNTYADGSLYKADSYLTADLFAGNYILAIGVTGMSVEDVIAGLTSKGPVACDGDPYFGCFLTDSDTGAYQVSVLGDVRQSKVDVSEPWTLSLMGLGIFGLAIRRRVSQK